ncbi:MAG: TetR/AcrR family transcriptional regulator [Deltaproteobacteria bacterium]|nr:TetR/AcrR family transcriptional regulator [Deltaproteobacteria bacterium]MBT4525368.1 TetR/AcrR family transcriptional regulator [Deltaproteobacteria bacterium]
MNKVSSKEKLFSACKKILLEEGQSALTVRRVAKVAGVNQGLIHHYFGSKENMVCQLLDYESTQFADNVKQYIIQTDAKKLPIKFLTETDLGKLLIEIILLSLHMPVLKEKVRDIIIDRRNFFGSIFGIENENDRIFLQICVLGSVILSFVDSTIKTPEVLQNLQEKVLNLAKK